MIITLAIVFETLKMNNKKNKEEKIGKSQNFAVHGIKFVFFLTS